MSLVSTGSGRTSPVNSAHSPVNGSKPAIPSKPSKFTEPSVLLELAENISKTATQIAKYISDNKLPQPSFEWDGPSELIPPAHRTGEMREAHMLLVDSAMKMWELAYGASDRVLTFHGVSMDAGVLRTVTHYRWYNMIPLGGEMSIKEIASRSNLDTLRTARVLRYAMSIGLFQEKREGWISHSVLSAHIAKKEIRHQFMSMIEKTCYEHHDMLRDCLVKYPKYSGEPSETPFAMWAGKDSFWEWLAENPEVGSTFPSSMEARCEGGGFDVTHVINAYKWDKLQKGSIVVDLGGSRGEIAHEIARRFNKPRFVVLDLPEVVCNPIPMADDMRDRFNFIGHNFFNEMPQEVHGADTYLIRQILHDWSNEYVKKILRRLVPALKDGATVLVNEFLLPEPCSGGRSYEKMVRLMDLTMYGMFGAQERTTGDLIRLFMDVDPKFRFVGVTTPQGSVTSLLEFKYEKDE